MALGHVGEDWCRKEAGQTGKTPIDPGIARGMNYLGGVLKEQQTSGKVLPIAAQSLGDLYYLWSVERVGMLYRQTHIGGTEWYPWGARLLVKDQWSNGHWSGQYGNEVNTCFALLFLKCANPTPDLSVILDTLEVPVELRLLVPVPDP
jgi:hypothetical protein